MLGVNRVCRLEHRISVFEHPGSKNAVQHGVLEIKKHRLGHGFLVYISRFASLQPFPAIPRLPSGLDEIMTRLELYGSSTCPFTTELREELEWQGRVFTEFDVDTDTPALRRMLGLTNGQRTVPVLVEDGQVVSIGYQGRGCVVNLPESA
jgi:glutaredoxin 3